MRVACALANLGLKGVVKTLLLSHATTGGVQKGSGDALCYSCRCSVGGETIRLSSQSSRVRYSAPLFFFPVFLFHFFFLYFFSMGGGILCMYVPFFCVTRHPPVITTAVLRGVPTLRAHSSAHTHRPGAHGLLEVPLHLLPSPAKLFQRRIRVKFQQVASLQSSFALSPRSLGIACGLPSGSSTQSVRCTCLLYTSPSPRDS